MPSWGHRRPLYFGQCRILAQRTGAARMDGGIGHDLVRRGDSVFYPVFKRGDRVPARGKRGTEGMTEPRDLVIPGKIVDLRRPELRLQ